MAAAVRQQALSTFADQRVLVVVPRLPFPGDGHFRRIGAGFEWVPVAYRNREPGVRRRFCRSSQVWRQALMKTAAFAEGAGSKGVLR